MFTKLLIANRGEIACRVIRSARALGIETVAVHSDGDADALHVRLADEAVHIGPSPAAESYLVIERLVEACRRTGADAVHPGYGFLSERAEFAEALAAEGIAFVGPPPSAIEAMGDKITSKRLAAEAGVSTVPGSDALVEDADQAVRIAREVGYPVMIKASAGGGGKGMRIALDDAGAREGFDRSRSEALASFGDGRLFIEKFVTEPRHIEIQVLCDAFGHGVYLGERECSIQRRNQKVVEEAPSPFIDAETRRAMGEQSLALARAVGYTSAGTVEFIVDAERDFYFLEMNTRLQVEHPVTELVTGVDLVEQMLRIAAGERLAIRQEDVVLEGWAIESRVYAEDPYRGFLPSIGRLSRYRPPAEGARTDGTRIRNDTGVEEGGEIPLHYDPMIAKLCTWAPTRLVAIETMSDALDAFEIDGIAHNLPFLAAIMGHERFRAGRLTTAFIDDEYPDGFAGVSPDESALDVLLASAVLCAAIDGRRYRALGDERFRFTPERAREDAVRVVRFGSECHRVQVTGEPERGNATLALADGRVISASTTWRPGETLVRVELGGRVFTSRITSTRGGYRLRRAGADVRLRVYDERVAELAALMPVKSDASATNALLCPMPGLLTEVLVAVGDAVEAGQSLAVVEAMKMENVLQAERRGVVRAIPVAPGDNLTVDQPIMEFEA